TEISVEAGQATVVTAQRADHHPMSLGASSGERDAEGGMTALLHEDAMPVCEQAPNRALELHDIADVAAPVVSVELGTLEALTGDGRIESDRGGSGTKRSKRFAKGLENVVHLRAVGGKADVDVTAEDTLRMQGLLEGGNGVDVSRDDARVCRI